MDLRIANYADDTAVNLNHPEDISKALAIVTDYGEASDIEITFSKTTAIALHANVFCPMFNGCIQFYYKPRRPTADVLESRLEALMNTLELGSFRGATKGTASFGQSEILTVYQRAGVAVAVILSKLLYVERQAWPQTFTMFLFYNILNDICHGTFQNLTEVIRRE